MATYMGVNQINLPNGDMVMLQDTTYDAATTSADGLMSSTDKSKLDDMEVATLSEFKTYLGIT